MEEVRSSLEELECLERSLTSALEDKTLGGSKTRLQRLNLSYKMAKLVEECLSNPLLSSKEKEKRAMERVLDEKRRIAEGGIESFFAAKQRLKEYYAKHSLESRVSSIQERCNQIGQTPPQWTGEERHGKYLDLHSFHARFQNVALQGKEERVSYVDFLTSLSNFSQVDLKVKSNKEYLTYLKDLYEYLHSFQSRADALVDIDVNRMDSQFQQNWQTARVPGWERKTLTQMNVKELLETFTPEELSSELLMRGAKAGGTPEQRAERLAFVEQVLGFGDENESDGRKRNPKEEKKLRKCMLFDAKEVAKWEVRVQALAELLSDKIDDTKQFVTRKQTLTYEELKQEEAEDRLREEGIDDDDEALYQDDEEEEVVVDNPLNLPLDYDGKPIPLWLYKLHGLGVEYKCEICGNYSYWGRKAFDRHFSDWRHAHGMRLLGIPNTKHFHHITGIDEARALYAKLQESTKVVGFSEDDQQVEDDQGRVYSKKTFLDLQRQGLV